MFYSNSFLYFYVTLMSDILASKNIRRSREIFHIWSIHTQDTFFDNFSTYINVILVPILIDSQKFKEFAVELIRKNI